MKTCATTTTATVVDGTVFALTDLDSSLDLTNIGLPIYLTADVVPGRTSVTLVAPTRQEVRVTVQVVYLSEGTSLRFFWNGATGLNAPPSAAVSGQLLPANAHDRTFIGSGGEMRVEYVSAVAEDGAAAEPSFFRVAVDVVCYSDAACGEHGDCVAYGGSQWAGPMQTMEGFCVCHDGWLGNGCGTKQRASTGGAGHR